MPIKFRCPHCQQFLGISRAKAGVVTDCPMCGRSIRVPNLDGSVTALADPKMNLADAGLRDALNELASLDDDAPPVAVLPPQVPVRLAPVPVPLRNVEQAVIAIEPLPMAAPVAPASVSPVSSASPSVAPSQDPLGELAAPVQQAAKTSSTPRNTTGRQAGASGLVLLVAVLGSFIAGMLLGYAVGSQTDPREQLTAELAPPADGPLADNAAPPLNAASPAAPAAPLSLIGHATYSSANNQILNDAGARVLLLPETHPGKSKLSVIGFRAGAAPSDRNVAEASVRAIGGEFVLADKTGHYRATLPAGRYHLLIMSRYSPRDENTTLVDAVQQMALSYFDSPQLLVGQVNYHYQMVTIDTTGTTIDHNFEQ